jgi:hypothetical protein
MRKIEPEIEYDTQNRWLLGEDLPGVNFKMCQWVRVVSGPLKGIEGELISLLRTAPEPAFHLETVDGGDEHVYQSEIESDDA